MSVLSQDEMDDEVQTLLFLIAALTNWFMFPEFRNMPEAERMAELARLKSDFEEIMR